MVEHGLTLCSEEHSPARLVGIAVAAEDAGFDLVSISDHFHPWIGEQGHRSIRLVGRRSPVAGDLRSESWRGSDLPFDLGRVG